MVSVKDISGGPEKVGEEQEEVGGVQVGGWVEEEVGYEIEDVVYDVVEEVEDVVEDVAHEIDKVVERGAEGHVGGEAVWGEQKRRM